MNIFLILILNYTDFNFNILRKIISIITEKSFWNLIKSNRKQIVFTLFRSLWNQTNVHLVPNQAENCKYYLISVWFNAITVCTRSCPILADCILPYFRIHDTWVCDIWIVILCNFCPEDEQQRCSKRRT